METKQFFFPGDMVTIRQEIPNKPTMLVVKKATKTISFTSKEGAPYKSDYFQGIVCRWFTLDGHMQEATFNTKDLIKL